MKLTRNTIIAIFGVILVIIAYCLAISIGNNNTQPDYDRKKRAASIIAIIGFVLIAVGAFTGLRNINLGDDIDFSFGYNTPRTPYYTSLN